MSCNNCTNVKKVMYHDTAASGLLRGSSISADYNPCTLNVSDEFFGKPHVLPGTFVYRDKQNNICRVSIERVIYSNPATIVFWDDGTKTVAKCSEENVYDPESGLLWCIAKKSYGNMIKDTVNAWCPFDEEFKPGKKIVQTLKKVRGLFRV